MHTYRKCVELIQRIENEYTYEALHTERRNEGDTHMSVKLQRWEDVAGEALEDNAQWRSMKMFKKDIQNWGEGAMDITKTYADFGELMRATMQEEYYQPPPDPRYYDPPNEYPQEYIQSQKDWVDCLVEMGKYIIYLEEDSVHNRDGFDEFCDEMNEYADKELHEESEDDQEESEEESVSFGLGFKDTKMTEMLCRLENL